MKSKTYLALDQALRKTGVAVFKDNKLFEHSTFEIKPTIPIEQRLTQFMAELNQLYNEYEFSELFFEDIQNQNNNETYKKLAYIQATIIIWCYSNNIRFHILSPSHWRKILKDNCGVSFGRKREEQKQAAIDFVKDKFHEEVTSDEADAICLGYAALQESAHTESAF